MSELIKLLEAKVARVHRRLPRSEVQDRAKRLASSTAFRVVDHRIRVTGELYAIHLARRIDPEVVEALCSVRT